MVARNNASNHDGPSATTLLDPEADAQTKERGSRMVRVTFPPWRHFTSKTVETSGSEAIALFYGARREIVDDRQYSGERAGATAWTVGDRPAIQRPPPRQERSFAYSAVGAIISVAAPAGSKIGGAYRGCGLPGCVRKCSKRF